MPDEILDPALITVLNALDSGRDVQLATLLDAFDGDTELLLGRHGGQTLLHRAVDAGRTSGVTFVLDAWRNAGLPLDARDDARQTALHRALRRPTPDVLEVLLDAGLELDAPDAHECTPLFLAAAEGREDLVQPLVRAGADVDAPREDGTTPLMIAVERQHTSMVRRLLDAGADPLLAEQGGLTARDLARKSPAEIKAILEKAEAWRSAQQRRVLKAVVVGRDGQGGFVLPRDLARSGREFRVDLLSDVKKDVERLLDHTLAESPVTVSAPTRRPAVPTTSPVVPSVPRVPRMPRPR